MLFADVKEAQAFLDKHPDRRLPQLPTDWLSALRTLEHSSWAQPAFGKAFLRMYLATKQQECRSFMAEVSEQDWCWFLHHA